MLLIENECEHWCKSGTHILAGLVVITATMSCQHTLAGQTLEACVRVLIVVQPRGAL